MLCFWFLSENEKQEHSLWEKNNCNRSRFSDWLAVSSIEVQNLLIDQKLLCILIFWYFVFWCLTLFYFDAFLHWFLAPVFLSHVFLTSVCFPCSAAYTAVCQSLCCFPWSPKSGGWTIIYRKLLSEAFIKLSKALKHSF